MLLIAKQGSGRSARYEWDNTPTRADVPVTVMSTLQFCGDSWPERRVLFRFRLLGAPRPIEPKIPDAMALSGKRAPNRKE